MDGFESLDTDEASAATIKTGQDELQQAGDIVHSASLGPPFAVGDEILCDPGDDHIVRAYVLKAEDPRYQLLLEDGREVDTGRQRAFLFPAPPPEKFAPPPPVAAFESMTSTLDGRGSFGLHVDAQLTSLERIREAKAFAKAVKADDAQVPSHLWNDRVPCSAGVEARDGALDAFRSMWWHKGYMRGLRRDCFDYMCQEHGEEWSTSRRRVDGKMTAVGRDQHAISNLIWHATHTNWFEYQAGSRLVHFRFPPRYQRMARDGVPIFFETPGPTSMEEQPPIYDSEKRAQVRSKVEKVMQRRYLLRTGWAMKSLIRYFGVPKGESDIRMVYDATANKLNDAVWVPPFWLPTSDSLLRSLDYYSWMSDRDIGDMFLNFQLHHSAIPFTGVDLFPLYDNKKELKAQGRYAHWDRNLMGFKSSPYNSIKMALVAEEVIKGDRLDTRVGLDGRELNPFQWKTVRLNLPGPGYDPTLPWVSKLREDGRIACDLHTFVDDERITAPSEELAWQAGHVLAATQSYLGIQDAARKVRPCSQTPGAWAGSVVHVLKDLGVCTLVSEEKWTKMKRIVERWHRLLLSGEVELPHAEFASDRGFLVYVTRTYPPLVPYLKGFHLSLEMWRGGRDAEGWKLGTTGATPPSEDEEEEDTSLRNELREWRDRTLGEEDEESMVSAMSLSSLDATRAGAHGRDPSWGDALNSAEENEGRLVDQEILHSPPSGITQAVPRLKEDIEALISLTKPARPVLRVVRPRKVVQLFYGFVDASGKQFGSTIARDPGCQSQFSEERTDATGLRFRVGVWSASEEAESSNYREFSNAVKATEELAHSGELRDSELFLFTDNSTAESCFWRGSSKSPKLHQLVIRLRRLEMEFGLQIHLIHVSGKRMIAQGTDGCSRGFLMEGVMAGENMLQFVDLHKPACDRHPPLLDWIRSWTQRKDLEPLTPEGWFNKGHGITGGSLDRHGVWMPTHGPKNEVFLWTPPPAAADAALEELARARHKRTDTFHVIAIPRLMLPRWRRLFNKLCDFTFVVSPGASFWPDAMYEPLWCGIILPFTHHRPWCFKRAPLLVGLGRDLRGLLASSEEDAGHLLRKLLLLPRWIAPLSERVARGVLHVPRAGAVPTVGD